MTVFSDYWWSAATNGPVPPDPGFSIGHSLRFRGTGQTLTNTDIQTTGTDNLWTLSLWVKYTNPEDNGTHIFHGNEGASATGFISILSSGTSSGNGAFTVNCGTGGTGFTPTMRLRDSSAWYHMVLTYNGPSQQISFTINGEGVTSGTGTIVSTGTVIDDIIFGRNDFEGYLSDIYFIDGQALEPTAFGRYNAEGVWVPREVDFSSSDLSSNVTVSTGGFAAPATLIFDGNDNTGAVADTNDAVMTFSPGRVPVNGDIELRLGTDNINATVTWNGLSYNWTAAGGTRQTAFADATGTINAATPLVITPAAGTALAWNAIWVNGTLLSDGAGYGPNGFHLDFSDPDDIGADRSGNENDFTPNNFNTAPVGIFSDDAFTVTNTGADNPDIASIATTTDKNFSNSVSGGFDGSSSTNVSATTGHCMVYRPSTSFENVTFIAVDQFRDQGVVLNGTDLGITTSTGVLTEIYSGAAITLESLCFYDKTAATGGFRIIQIAINNGTPFMLVNNTGVDYDLVEDSPTQNWATLNPPINPRWGPNGNTGDATTYTGANLRAGTPGGPVLSAPTQYMEKIYFEIGPTLGADNDNYPGIIGFDLEDYWNRTASDMFNVLNTGEWRMPGQATTTAFDSWSAADIARVKYDGATRILSIAVNDGAFRDQDMSAFIPAGTKIGIGLQVFSGDGIGCINYGQQPFKYAVPNGFSASQTQNMPDVTVSDSRDQFRAITGPGQGPGSGTPGAGPWSTALRTGSGAPVVTPALAFDGNTGTAAQSQGNPDNSPLFFEPADSIDYTTNVRVWADTTSRIFLNGTDVAAAANSWVEIATGSGSINSIEIRAISGTPWLNAVEVDGVVLRDMNILAVAQQTFHTGLWWIKDRVNNNKHQLVDNVNGTTDVMQTNPPSVGNAYSEPSGNSIAYCWNASTEGGFSITNGTHGLGRTPAMVVDRANNFWHRSLPAGEGMVLGGTSGTSSQSWTVNETTVSGPGGGSYFTWAEIPGFSAFGSYTANNNASGPVIYTNFRPAFLLIQRFDSNSGAQWVIVDSTIYPQNLSPTPWLAAWREDGEITSGEADLDIFANGFKLRTTNSETNNGSGQYLYAAFAQHPFGGANTSPANAR